MKFLKKKLKNGLKIVAVPLKDSQSVTVMVVAKTGSEDEIKDKSGISHFLEHVCFKGTKNRPKVSQISTELDSIGASHNAFTSNEYTAYYAKAHPKHFIKVLDILSDMYMNQIFPEKELEKEKGVVLQEISMYNDLPQRKVGEVFMKMLYGNQPAGWSIAGNEETVKSIKRDDLIKYVSNNYVSSNTTVVVSGNIKPKEVFDSVKKYFKDIKVGKKTPKKKVLDIQKNTEVSFFDKKTDQVHLIVGMRAFDLFDKRNPALIVANSLFGVGLSSRLSRKIREEMGVAYYVGSEFDSYSDHGIFSVSAGVDPKKLKEFIEAVLTELKKLRDELVPEDELNKAKEFIIGNMSISLDSSDSIAEFVVFQEVMKNKIKNLSEIESEIRKVTPKQIKLVFEKIISNNNLNLAIVGGISPEEKKELLKIFKF